MKEPNEIRINELARELVVKAKVLIEYLPEIGVTEKKTHSSSIDNEHAELVRKHFLGLAEAEAAAEAVKKARETAAKANPAAKPAPAPVARAAPAMPAAPAPAVARPPAPVRPSGATAPPGTRPGVQPSAARETLHHVRVEPAVLRLPRKFSFHHRGFVDFDDVLGFFDWSLRGVPVMVDITTCESTNYQALALLIQYVWVLTMRGCSVRFKYGVTNSGATKMLSKMGALEWLQVLTMDGRNFGERPGQTLALRRRADVQNTINTARKAIQTYTVGFPDYLSYIISELLYNATEHGLSQTIIDRCQVIVPSVFQFGRTQPLIGWRSFSAISGWVLKLTLKECTRRSLRIRTR